jgi:hypothetical protein
MSFRVSALGIEGNEEQQLRTIAGGKDTPPVPMRNLGTDIELALGAPVPNCARPREGPVHLIQPAVGSGLGLAGVANGLKPMDKTPLSAAVVKAAETLQYTEDKAKFILPSLCQYKRLR